MVIYYIYLIINGKKSKEKLKDITATPRKSCIRRAACVRMQAMNGMDREVLEMEGRMIGFVIWCIAGSMFVGMGMYAWFLKKPVPMGFWANAKMFEVVDVKKYNRAMAKLFCMFGIVFIALGVPLLAGQNSGWIVLSIVGVMAESITAMAVYSLKIEKKYKKDGGNLG